ncbi:MAG TPA: selenide, water dikinase SelD [Terriglobales bacterium]
MSPAALDAVLGKLARQQDPNVLVGFDKADDAGVYKISPDLALVQTVDFFTPVVDDPYTFGQIAATNSLSDVYAMGGRPLNALTLVCFPDKGDLDILEQILAGGLSKMIEAGCTIVGGHSIRDEELKFGYAVTGTIRPDRVLANSGARPGDSLIFTKALGTGVISTAIKKGKAEQSWIDAATVSMTTLNKAASEVITTFNECHPERARPQLAQRAKDLGERPAPETERSEVSAEAPTRASLLADGRQPIAALTDITGFGLIGHAREMALASDVSLRLRASAVPLLPGALDCVRAGFIPGGLKNNRDFAECAAEFDAAVPQDVRTLLFDPQTAGGLFISVAANSAGDLLAALHAKKIPAALVGEVVPRTKPLISVCA